MSDTFARVRGLHPRFDVHPSLVPGLDWIPCERLHGPSGPELAAVVEAERHGSGHVSDHATALTLAAVYSCTVTAIGVAAWALDGSLVDVAADTMAIALGEHHGFEAVGVREVRLRPDAPVEAVVDTVLTRHLLPLVDALEVVSGASRRQLLGGAAQGCAEAFGIASRRGGDVDTVAAAYDAFADAALGLGIDLHDLGRLVRVEEGDQVGLFYLRRTCCLTYTSAEAEFCASCSITPEAERLAAYRAALRR